MRPWLEAASVYFQRRYFVEIWRVVAFRVVPCVLRPPVDAPFQCTFPWGGGAWGTLYACRSPFFLAGSVRLYSFILRHFGSFSELYLASLRGSKHKGTEYACHFNGGISVSSVPEQKDCAYISESGLIPAQTLSPSPPHARPPPLGLLLCESHSSLWNVSSLFSQGTDTRQRYITER